MTIMTLSTRRRIGTVLDEVSLIATVLIMALALGGIAMLINIHAEYDNSDPCPTHADPDVCYRDIALGWAGLTIAPYGVMGYGVAMSLYPAIRIVPKPKGATARATVTIFFDDKVQADAEAKFDKLKDTLDSTGVKYVADKSEIRVRTKWWQ